MRHLFHSIKNTTFDNTSHPLRSERVVANNWVDITYHFAARPNQLGLQLGNIGTVNKRGWDYLWVKHDEEVVGDRVLQTPAAAYVEQVYPEGNFYALGISLLSRRVRPDRHLSHSRMST